jgi:hypothetical protein
MSKWIVSAVLCTGFVFACGGGSGSDKKVIELSAGERQDACEEFVDILGPEREVACPDGPVTVGASAADVAECVSSLDELAAGAPNCTLTVSQYRSCIEAIADLSDDQICTGEELPAACAPLLSESCSPAQ